MIKKVKVTAALMAVGIFTSLGYAAVAQTNQPATQLDQPADQLDPTTRPATQLDPTTRPTTQPNSTKISTADKQFMINAAQGGMAEVELSQLALASQRAASNEVKQFAQQMIQDHTRANNKLSQLAKQKGVTLPTEMDAQHKALRTQLEKISGRSFDQQYMNAMETDHAKTVALFQSQTQQGQDPDLTAFAATTLPKLQQHWQMARAMTGNPAAQNPNSPKP